MDGIEGFDAVVVAEMGLERAMRVNEACRRHGKPFFAAFSGASAAWFFADLGDDAHGELVLEPTNAFLRALTYQARSVWSRAASRTTAFAR